jgi:head-tail adaptor
MKGAGEYDRKVEFLKRGVVKDGMGTEVEGFAAFAPAPLLAWATVRFGSSADRRASAEARIADGIVSSQAATFRVRSTARLRTVTEGDAIAYRGARWGIQSIAEAAEQGHEIEFTATRLGN